jgi:hypothetical protein
MKYSDIVLIIYIIGLIIGALFLGLWDAQTGLLKAFTGIIWTTLFLIALFFANKRDVE